MLILRRISEYRPTLILIFLVLLSLVSLASGTRASLVGKGVNAAVSIVSYPFLKVMTAIEHGIDYAVGLVIFHNAAVRENVELRRQQAMLLQHTVDRAELNAENRRLRGLLDFERAQPRLTLEPVQVIAAIEGTLSIDRGARHGIRPGMCALTPDGIVGVVTDAYPIVASVATLQKADCKIGAMIRRNRVRGVVHGSGNSLSTVCTLRYIDIKDDVRVGDEVVTSPESRFPSGYLIGKVIAVHDERSLLKTAEIQPSANPYQLDEIFIVMKAEVPLEELAGAPGAGDTGALAAQELETKTIQERYAP